LKDTERNIPDVSLEKIGGSFEEAKDYPPLSTHENKPFTSIFWLKKFFGAGE
jgi:hypothetical protein